MLACRHLLNSKLVMTTFEILRNTQFGNAVEGLNRRIWFGYPSHADCRR